MAVPESDEERPSIRSEWHIGFKWQNNKMQIVMYNVRLCFHLFEIYRRKEGMYCLCLYAYV